MRTSRRTTTVTIAPPQWRSRCRLRVRTSVHPIPSHARLADRSWVLEIMYLADDDYVECRGSWSERHAARHMRCVCGEDMELHAFEKVGHAGELLGYRTFAVCAICRWWAEF
jgi:hypothetical protein